MNQDPKYNSKMLTERRRKSRKRRMRNTALGIFILLFVAITIFIENYGDELNAKQISGNTLSSTQSSNNNSGIDTKNSTAWNLIFVNPRNYIPDNYTLVLKTLSNGHQIDERIYPELQEMFDAARNAGVYPLLRDAFRTPEQQQKLFEGKINAYIAEGCTKNEAKTLAQSWVAAPGTSEHQLGLALDIDAEKDKCTNDEVYKWLAKNSYKYGFILRYPSNKVEITGANYEPWHYRYVGKEVAKEIYMQGICLEEYLNIHK